MKTLVSRKKTLKILRAPERRCALGGLGASAGRSAGRQREEQPHARALHSVGDPKPSMQTLKTVDP